MTTGSMIEFVKMCHCRRGLHEIKSRIESSEKVRGVGGLYERPSISLMYKKQEFLSGNGDYILAVSVPLPIFVALGSNIEPRSLYLSRARQMLAQISEGHWVESSVYQTAAVGPGEQAPYLNQVVRFDSCLGPKVLLDHLKGVEIFLGRKARGHWEKREIDLDLLYRGPECFQDLSVPLFVPHERIAERAFVLIPLCEIAPDWIDPKTGKSAKDMLESLKRLYRTDDVIVWEDPA